MSTGPSAEEKQEQCDAFDFIVSNTSESILTRVVDRTSANDV